MTKRLQVPLSDADRSHLKAAARRAGLPLAEWARRELRLRADRILGAPSRTPTEALDSMFQLEAPVADVEAMIEESVHGRLR